LQPDGKPEKAPISLEILAGRAGGLIERLSLPVNQPSG